MQMCEMVDGKFIETRLHLQCDWEDASLSDLLMELSAINGDAKHE